MKKLISALILCTSFSALANSFQMSVTIQGKDIYNTQGAQLNGAQSFLSGTVNAYGIFDG